MCEQQQRVVASLGGAPVALAEAGLLEGEAENSHPAVMAEMASDGYREDRRVVRAHGRTR